MVLVLVTEQSWGVCWRVLQGESWLSDRVVVVIGAMAESAKRGGGGCKGCLSRACLVNKGLLSERTILFIITQQTGEFVVSQPYVMIINIRSS